MIISEDLFVLLQDERVQVYLIVLAIAIYKCNTIYQGVINDSSSTSGISKQNSNNTVLSIISRKIIPPILSVCIIGITWFYIFRFILTHQFTSESYFDDAYKDVLREHYFSSTQLLTWAIVAVVWVSEEGGGGSVLFLLYGFLGAMGASFVLWVPLMVLKKKQKLTAAAKRKFVPVVFLFTSIVSFYCIVKIRPCENDGQYFDDKLCSEDLGFGSFLKSFRFYLHGLHLVLLLPIAVTLLFPAKSWFQVDSALLYGLTGIVLSIWHLSQLLNKNNTTDGWWSSLTMSPSSSPYRIPETDCQKSIHIDLLCCSVLTLYAIYHDTNNGSSDSSTLRAMRTCSVSALLMPILSPAAVLSFHLCIVRLPATHRHMVGKAQRQMAQRRSAKKDCHDDIDGWCNLGLWTNASDDYDIACENLALELANQADLKPGDGVLSCGCGVTGKELSLYHSRFNLGHITGIDPSVQNNSNSYDEQNIRKVQASVDDLISGMEHVLLRPYMFNKIVALDNIYHYQRKLEFFQYCMKILPHEGKVAVTDIIFKNNAKYQHRSLLLKIALSAMGVKSSSVWTETEYVKHLESIGYCNIIVKRIGSQVFAGWKEFLPNSILRHLDYCVITASKRKMSRSGTERSTTKKRVAVIGSGMAGLAAAHAIYSSAQSNNIEVTIYEAGAQPGLAGNSMKVGNHIVDVPARMANMGYYHEYIKLVKKLGVSYQVVNTDCLYHGGDGMGGYVKHIYERSAWSNCVFAVLVGGLGNLWNIFRSFSTIPHLLKDISSSCQGLSFGDWLHGHLNIYPPSSAKCKDYSKHQGWQFSYFAKHDNAFLYMAIGSFGWMLSCTYRQLLACPADILLPYIDGLGLTKCLGMFKKADIVRIEPSIKALEHAILYGIDFRANARITNLDERKIINGVQYDAVVCATEAGVVNNVIRTSATVFGQFHYHPSTIYLHNDASLLPENRADWRTWEVRMEPEQEEPLLTFWLNRYYDSIKFDGDVFQTWAPLKPPRDECVIRKFEMSRVIHTSASKDMVKLVENEQGKEGFYYAGSYVVYGMGLLEQAATSGRLTGERVVTALFGGEKNI